MNRVISKDIHTPVHIQMKADRIYLTFVDLPQRDGFVNGLGGAKPFTEDDPYNVGQLCPRIEVGEEATISFPCFVAEESKICVAFADKSMMKAFVHFLGLQYKKMSSGQPLVTAKKNGAILVVHDKAFFHKPRQVQALNMQSQVYNAMLRQLMFELAKTYELLTPELENKTEKEKLKHILIAMLQNMGLIDKSHPPRVFIQTQKDYLLVVMPLEHLYAIQKYVADIIATKAIVKVNTLEDLSKFFQLCLKANLTLFDIRGHEIPEERIQRLGKSIDSIIEFKANQDVASPSGMFFQEFPKNYGIKEKFLSLLGALAEQLQQTSPEQPQENQSEPHEKIVHFKTSTQASIEDFKDVLWDDIAIKELGIIEKDIDDQNKIHLIIEFQQPSNDGASADSPTQASVAFIVYYDKGIVYEARRAPKYLDVSDGVLIERLIRLILLIETCLHDPDKPLIYWGDFELTSFSKGLEAHYQKMLNSIQFAKDRKQR